MSFSKTIKTYALATTLAFAITPMAAHAATYDTVEAIGTNNADWSPTGSSFFGAPVFDFSTNPGTINGGGAGGAVSYQAQTFSTLTGTETLQYTVSGTFSLPGTSGGVAGNYTGSNFAVGFASRYGTGPDDYDIMELDMQKNGTTGDFGAIIVGLHGLSNDGSTVTLFDGPSVTQPTDTTAPLSYAVTFSSLDGINWNLTGTLSSGTTIISDINDSATSSAALLTSGTTAKGFLGSVNTPNTTAGDVTINSASFTAPAPVPEPSAYALILCSLLVFGGIAFRRKNSKA